METEVTCPCGTIFITRARPGRGKYCSRECMYRYRTRPTGLKYEIKKENPTMFRPGNEPWNKGKILKDEITYKELHRWVARHKTKTGKCQHCGEIKKTQWANKSHEYKRDLADWIELCRKCHGRYDSGRWWGMATDQFGAGKVQNG